ncbi:MAG: hypothetical protein JNK00_12700 [Flavipsychrobacter sp.]|nr:hypothetical protein [Flavipsychrobacter sp.]
MKKLLLFFGMALVCALNGQIASAKGGKAGLGLRATPDGGGFTAKLFFDKYLAFEGQLNAGGINGGWGGPSFNAVGLLTYHIILPDPSWRIFMGGGVHAGVWDRGWRYVSSEGRYMDDNRGILGVDGIGGVEYVFKKIPLGLSADIKPAINFLSEAEFFSHNMVGLSARFYFK